MRNKVISDFENICEEGDLKDIKSPPLISKALLVPKVALDW
jgi:hypothetical protein